MIFRRVNLKGQHIGRLFTFLAGLIILAHAVVPHHHHFEVTHSSELESTCESSSKDKKNENSDTHCHTFNLLISKKATNSSLNYSLPEYPSFYLIGIIANIKISPFQNISSICLVFKSIFLKQFFIIAPSLRGPPTFA